MCIIRQIFDKEYMYIVLTWREGFPVQGDVKGM